jgi:hypothetical protein
MIFASIKENICLLKTVSGKVPETRLSQRIFMIQKRKTTLLAPITHKTLQSGKPQIHS